jgi:hypothetical protein
MTAHKPKSDIYTENCPHEHSGKGCPIKYYLKCQRDSCKYQRNGYVTEDTA